MVENMPLMKDRLELIKRVCKFPSQAAFTNELGEKSTQWKNWSERESVGRADVRIHNLTNVDLVWLKTGKGKPFPNGPKIYSKSQPERHEERIRVLELENQDLGAVVSLAIRVIAGALPDAGRDLLELLKNQAPSQGQTSLALAGAIDAAETALRPAAADRRAGSPRAPVGKR